MMYACAGWLTFYETVRVVVQRSAEKMKEDKGFNLSNSASQQRCVFLTESF
jgi:hypothetical protein